MRVPSPTRSSCVPSFACPSFTRPSIHSFINSPYSFLSFSFLVRFCSSFLSILNSSTLCVLFSLYFCYFDALPVFSTARFFVTFFLSFITTFVPVYVRTFVPTLVCACFRFSVSLIVFFVSTSLRSLVFIPLMFLSSTLSITGSMYSSTSLNRMGNPYLMASSSCFRKSGSLKVTT